MSDIRIIHIKQDSFAIINWHVYNTDRLLFQFLGYASVQAKTKTEVTITTTDYDNLPVANIPYTYPLNTLNIAPYKSLLDTATYNELKKNIYKLNQKLGEIGTDIQAVFDYNSLYKKNLIEKSKLDEKVDSFNKTQKLFNDQYQKYQEALSNFEAKLPKTVRDEFISINELLP